MTAWYPLDEPVGPIAADLIAGNNGIHLGGPIPLPGKVAGALSFNGVNQYVSIPTAPAVNFGTGDFSIDTWIRTAQSQGLAVFLDKRSFTPVGYECCCSTGASTSRWPTPAAGATTATPAASTSPMAPGTWWR